MKKKRMMKMKMKMRKKMMRKKMMRKKKKKILNQKPIFLLSLDNPFVDKRNQNPMKILI